MYVSGRTTSIVGVSRAVKLLILVSFLLVPTFRRTWSVIVCSFVHVCLTALAVGHRVVALSLWSRSSLNLHQSRWGSGWSVRGFVFSSFSEHLSRLLLTAAVGQAVLDSGVARGCWTCVRSCSSLHFGSGSNAWCCAFVF